MRKRAGIILVCNDEILFIKRIKNGNQYYVIPGGGIEKDENIISAAVREIREEINLEINKKDINKFCEIKNQGRTEIYFITEIKKQEFIICGEEAERSNADNVYIPEWVSINKLQEINLLPEEIKNKIIKINI